MHWLRRLPCSQICEHGRRRSQCKECGGSSFCEHGRQRSYCKECGGSQICEHGRRRYDCKECVRSPRIIARDAEAPTGAKVEVKDEPEDVADPGVEVKEEPEDVEDPGEEDDSLL